MDDTTNLQKRLFKHIKDRLPLHVSLVDEVSSLLDISNDSAYRRIRGEKQLLLEELHKLCVYFNISIDAFIKNPVDTVPFTYVSVDEDLFTIEDYLEMLLNQARAISTNREAQLLLVANDLTIFQLLQIPELAAFKIFFWLKSGLGFTKLQDEKFSIEAIPDSVIQTSKAFVHEYVGINTIEIVGINAVNSFLRQIRYYLDSGFFHRDSDALLICEKLAELVRHFHREANLGYKFPYGQKPAGRPGNFTMYYNELFIIDGILLLRLNEAQFMTYIASGPLNYVATNNPEFYESKYSWVKNLMKRSIMLSGLSERMRNQYFLQIEETIEAFKNTI